MKFYKALQVIFKLGVLPLALLLTASIHQDERRFAPGSDPDEELASFKIQDGFEITLFAAEPMVVNPVQMSWDADGRL